MALRELDSVDAAASWLVLQGARALAVDSRRVGKGDAFIAWPGHTEDARRFVGAALRSGAAACLVERAGVEVFGFSGDPRIAAVDSLKATAGRIAGSFLGRPSERLRVVAVTGTNGKTSTTWWIAQALTGLGRRCGVVGTLGIGEPPTPPGDATESTDARPGPGPVPRAAPIGAVAHRPIESTGLTTPDAVTLQTALQGFVDDGFAACAIEASSIGIAEHRLAGTRVSTAVFTNFTQDHLDYHGDMAAYWQVKASLFASAGLEAAVVNIDDERGRALAESLDDGLLDAPFDEPKNAPFDEPKDRAGDGDGDGDAMPKRRAIGDLARTPVDLWTCACRSAARLQAIDIRCDSRGLAFSVREGEGSVAVSTALIGAYNVSNLLAVIGVLRAGGVSLVDAAVACDRLTPVPGRMQRVAAAGVGPEVVVDYAHTPDALEQALMSLQPFAVERGGELWCVFGCGGDRDAAKRPMMGALARRLAPHVVVTSDNPRFESPDFIISQVLAGLIGHDDVDVIESRADAIRHAVGSASARDVVLIAGKGHEDYQDIGGVKLPFSDAAVAAAALAQRTS